MSRSVAVLAAALSLALLTGAQPVVAQTDLTDVGLVWRGNGRVTTGSAARGVDVPVLRGWPGNAESVTDVAADGSLLLSQSRVVATDDTGARKLRFPTFSATAIAFTSAFADRVVAGLDGRLSTFDLHELMTIEDPDFGLHQPEETVLTATDELVTRGWVAPDHSQLLFVDGSLLKAIELPVGQANVVMDTADHDHIDIAWSPTADRYVVVLTDRIDGRYRSQLRTRDHQVVTELSAEGRQVTGAAFNPSGTALWLEWIVPTEQGGGWVTAGVATAEGTNVQRLGLGSDDRPQVGPSRAVWLDDDTLLVPNRFNDTLDTWEADEHGPSGAIGHLDQYAFQPDRRLPVRGPANLPPLEPQEISETAGRLTSDSPIDAATSLSVARFGDGGATHAVLARHDVFADSLAGAALTADGPMLYTTRDALVPSTAQELNRALMPGATVYVLGGEAAVSDAVERELEGLGFEPRRLAGPGRIETSVAIAKEVLRRHAGTELYLARAGAPASNPTAAWADSASVGAASVATGIPVVVVGDTLHPAVAELIEDAGITNTTVLGGTAAVPDEVLSALPSPRRLAGPTRFATAVAIADDVFDLTGGTSGEMVLVNGEHRDGWALSFAAAGYAADRDIPVVLTGTLGLPAEVLGALDNCDSGFPVMLGTYDTIGRGVDTDHYEACRAT